MCGRKCSSHLRRRLLEYAGNSGCTALRSALPAIPQLIKLRLTRDLPRGVSESRARRVPLEFPDSPKFVEPPPNLYPRPCLGGDVERVSSSVRLVLELPDELQTDIRRGVKVFTWRQGVPLGPVPYLPFLPLVVQCTKVQEEDLGSS